jgi:hypothetical protein
MSFVLVAMESDPDALWTFDDPSPFTDWSGHGRSASTTATAKHAALVKGSDYSLIVDNATKISANAAAVMQRGREKQSFTVETVFRSIKKDPTNTAYQQVWGNDNGYDGIVIAGTVVSFVTKYTSTGEARCSYDIQLNRRVHVAAIHTATKNSLYIDGDMVAEVDITEAQQADTYLYDGNTITMGGTTSTNVLAINALAVYRSVVSEDELDAHYVEGTDNVSEFHVAAGYGGTIVPLTEDYTAPYESRTFTTEADWNSGLMAGTIVEYEQLVPQMNNGISVPATWTVAHPLPQGLGTLYGVTLNWQGQGVTVETSVDGNTWASVPKGNKTPTIPAGFNPTNQVLQIRATFPGGIVDDPSYIDDLSVTTFINNTLPPVDGRTVTLTNTSIESNDDIMDFDTNWGAELNNGSISIAAGGSFPVKTIEIWEKKASGASFTDNITPTTSYTNGTTLQVYRTDEWQLRTYVISAGTTGAITISGTGQVGSIVLYPYAKTAAQVLETYRAYVGKPKYIIPTQGNIAILELTDQIDAYEYEWSVETAG